MEVIFLHCGAGGPQLKRNPLGGMRLSNVSSALRAMRLRYFALVLLILTGAASALALEHMDNLPAFLLLAPGYLVQAWLFERHLALGGIGYQATMIGVSAIVWTLIVLTLALAVRLVRRVRRSHAA